MYNSQQKATSNDCYDTVLSLSMTYKSTCAVGANLASISVRSSTQTVINVHDNAEDLDWRLAPGILVACTSEEKSEFLLGECKGHRGRFLGDWILSQELECHTWLSNILLYVGDSQVVTFHRDQHIVECQYKVTTPQKYLKKLPLNLSMNPIQS